MQQHLRFWAFQSIVLLSDDRHHAPKDNLIHCHKKYLLPLLYLLSLPADTMVQYLFCGSVLNYLLEHDVDHLTEEQLIEMLRISNAAAYLLSQQKRVRFVLCRIRMKSKKLLKVNSTHIFNLCITVFIQFMQSFFDVSKAGVYELSIKITVNDGNLMQFSHCK